MALEVVRKHGHPLNGGNFLQLSEPECFSETSKAIPVAQRLGASAWNVSASKHHLPGGRPRERPGKGPVDLCSEQPAAAG